MNLRCFRCNGELENTTPEEEHDVTFYSCKNCSCAYTKNTEGRIYDRWSMPITLPLYGVIFDKDPLSKVEHIVADMASREKEFKDILVEHISAELADPKQRITDIHNFEFPNEDNLREFLRLVKEGIQK